MTVFFDPWPSNKWSVWIRTIHFRMAVSFQDRLLSGPSTFILSDVFSNVQDRKFFMQKLTGKWHFSAPKTALLANKILKIFILCLYSLSIILLPVNWWWYGWWREKDEDFGGIGLEEYGWLGWRRINGARILHHL